MGHMLRGLTEQEKVLYTTVGSRVDDFCKQYGLNAPDFAALVGMGVPASRVGEWRRRKSPSSVEVYRRVEHVLNFYGKEEYVQPTRLPTVVELRHQDPNYNTEAISARLKAYRHKEGGIPYGDIAARLESLGCTVTTVQLAHYARGGSLPPPPTYLSLKAALDRLEGVVSGDVSIAPTNQSQASGSIDQLLVTFQRTEGDLQKIRTTLLDGVLAVLAPHLPTTHDAAKALQEPLTSEQRAEYAVSLKYALYLVLDTEKMDPTFRAAFAAMVDPKDVGYLQTLLEAMALPTRDFTVSISEAQRPPRGPRRKS